MFVCCCVCAAVVRSLIRRDSPLRTIILARHKCIITSPNIYLTLSARLKSEHLQPYMSNNNYFAGIGRHGNIYLRIRLRVCRRPIYLHLSYQSKLVAADTRAYNPCGESADDIKTKRQLHIPSQILVLWRPLIAPPGEERNRSRGGAEGATASGTKQLRSETHHPGDSRRIIITRNDEHPFHSNYPIFAKFSRLSYE